VVLSRLVGGRGDDRDAVPVGVLDRAPRQLGVVQRAQRLLNY
jgi:hypothetical protein